LEEEEAYAKNVAAQVRQTSESLSDSIYDTPYSYTSCAWQFAAMEEEEEDEEEETEEEKVIRGVESRDMCPYMVTRGVESRGLCVHI